MRYQGNSFVGINSLEVFILKKRKLVVKSARYFRDFDYKYQHGSLKILKKQILLKKLASYIEDFILACKNVH